MLKREQISKEGKLPRRTKKGRQIEMLLGALCVFSKQGKEEVSVSEFQESIAEFQQFFPSLGYSYSRRFPYSLDLLSDLKDLYHGGFVHQYNYRHDAFLPKRFLALTALGKGRGWKILEMLSDDEIQSLQNSVITAIRNHENRWRLWAR